MSGGRSAAHVRVAVGALLVVPLVWSLPGTALAAAPASPDLAASGVVAQPDVPRHAGTVAPKPKDTKTRPSDLLSPMGRLAQKAQAALAKKQGKHFDSLDKDICGDQQECEEANSDPDFDGPAGGQAETSIAVDSTGQHIVVGFNDTRGFALNPTSVSGFMYSDDGGATFVDGGQLPSPGADLIGATHFPQVFGDPEVKYLGGSNFIYLSILVKKLTATGTAQTMGFHRSTDYGHTWTGPFEITSATNPHGLLIGGNARDAADKEFADVDLATGRVIMSWSNFTSTAFAPAGVEISTTYSDNVLDTAPTWAPRTILGATVNDGQSAIPRFSGDGKAYVAWRRFGTGGAGLLNNVGFSVSNDGGNTWAGATNTAASFFFSMDQVLGNDRVNTSPSLAVDRSGGARSGNLYLVYANNDNHDGADIAFQRSTSSGATWSAPLLLNSRPGNDRAQWFPWVTVDSTSGRVYVFYYDQGIATSGDLTETTYLFSDDGGSTWSAPRPLSDRPFRAGWGNDPGQPNLGDYNQAVAQASELFAVWAGTTPVPFADGQPALSFTIPDVVFKRVPASSPRAPLRLGAVGFSDSGNGGNGAIDRSERVTFTVPLENYVTNLGAMTVNGISATLSTSTPGVTIVQGTSAYPSIPPGGSAINAAPFVVQTSTGFVLGTTIELSLSVTSAQGPARLLHRQETGTPIATVLLSENFNAVAPGTFPVGWVTAHGGGSGTVPWTTSSTFCGTGSNGAFHVDDATPAGGSSPTRFERLFSPLFAVPAAAENVILEFDVCYDTEDEPAFNVQAYDGLTLRITDQTTGRTLRSNLAEAFATSIKTGASEHFPKHLPRGTQGGAYFEDMSVWAGDSQGSRHVVMKLPGMAGSTAQLRFEYTQDANGTCTSVRPTHTSCGVLVDNIVVTSVVSVQPADVTPPVLREPADQIFEATGPTGAAVTYSPCTATDDFVAVTVTHDHPSGAIFPLGTTLVNCTATDGAGNTTNGSFEVTVIDTTPPSITAPPDQVVEAASAAGAVVTYPACTSGDAVSPPAIAYNYASGSTFPLGTTMVICTATDAAGNANSATFDITVQDTTTPVVTFTGNETPYTVDQNVHITCAATDAVGVVATDGCVTIDGPAHGFGVGSHTFVATAKDAAGHVGITSVTFEVRVTTASLCTLTERFTSKGGVAHSLCVKLQNAAAALARGDTKAHDNELRAYGNEVSAQSGKAISDADALVLIGLAGRL